MSKAFYLLIAQSDLLKLHTPVLLKDAKKLASEISKKTGERVHVFKHVYDVEHIVDADEMVSAKEFDRKFDNGESVVDHLVLSPDQLKGRVPLPKEWDDMPPLVDFLLNPKEGEA